MILLGLQTSMIASPSWAAMGCSIHLWKTKRARTDTSIQGLDSAVRYQHTNFAADNPTRENESFSHPDIGLERVVWAPLVSL